jgi:hypothetical protein
VHKVYNQLMNELTNFINDWLVSINNSISTLKDTKFKLLANISNHLVSLERSPAQWSILQFKHVSHFPEMQCDSCCETICFSCGCVPFHTGQTCLEYMRVSLKRQSNSEEFENIFWKLDNSKFCPNCSVLITRSEGCNKVDCLFCGHKFCWNCLDQFENGSCSYYRCQITGIINQLEDSPQEHTEIGVPNVIKIQSKQISPAH